MRAPGGRWSLVQAHLEAGITHAAARACAEREGYVDAANLTEDDVVILKTYGALQGAPHPEGITRFQLKSATRARDEAAMDAVRVLLEGPVTGMETLVVLPHTAQMAADAMKLLALVTEHSTTPRLLLPVGAWIKALPSRAGS